jgi:hypothetical protein
MPFAPNSNSMRRGGGNSFGPSAMRLFAARTEKLRSSRALVKLLNDELHPDDLFTDLVGDFDDVRSRRWLQAVAIALDSAPQLAAPGSDACRQPPARVAGFGPGQRRIENGQHMTAITTSILRLASSLSRLSASLQPLTGLRP